MTSSRRNFLTHASGVAAGFLGLNRYLQAQDAPSALERYGALVPDAHKILDLPAGFQYRVLSRLGDRMSDGYRVPGQPDGMAAFPGADGRVILVRNHEIGHAYWERGPFEDNRKLPKNFDPALCYDRGSNGSQPFVGGTTNLVYHPKTGEVESQFLSLFGTDRNCAGGPTPWGTWITCEEPEDLTSPWGLRHGYCFEVPATAEPGLVTPEPLRGLGRFRHEAIAVHPASGIVYLTEDRSDGMIYRFVPDVPGDLRKSGKLQALAIRGHDSANTRNWPGDKETFPIGTPRPVRWIDLEDIEGRYDDLRDRGVKAGAARFSRGEGMWYGSGEKSGGEAIYWCCTDGGAITRGQVFRYRPGPAEGRPGEDDRPGTLELYLEPNDQDLLENGDNITVAPWGDLIICEDSKSTNAVRGVTPAGEIFTLARNALNDSEFAGACFSPDGAILFVNIQTPGLTLAITGPWKKGTETAS